MKALREKIQRPAGDIEALAIPLRETAHPLSVPDDLDPLMERIGDAHFVLLGEASHGTHEYYTWRAEISRRLIEEKGFNFVAVEGDWPDCYTVNRYVKGYKDSGGSAREVLHAFNRWPTWMWANDEVAGFSEWLRRHNGGLLDDRKAGFYGLDVYSLWDSMQAVIHYLEKVDGKAVEAAKRAFRCFEPFSEDLQDYAWHTAWAPQTCEEDVVKMLVDLRSESPQFKEDGEAYFNAEQNALVAKNAERYYRAMIRSGPGSWNIRDMHMADTLDRLANYHGPNAKAIVWEHNTHVGDARYTDMASSGMYNVGELTRDRHAKDGVVLVGFGSHHGAVIAGRGWGEPMQRMRVPNAMPGSWEDILHVAGPDDKLFLTDDLERTEDYNVWRGHRAIGVVYDPDRERGNYVPTVLPRRYDAFLYIDATHAVRPLHMPVEKEGEVPETYPTAV